MTIFYHDCKCGATGADIRRVQAAHPSVEIRNSKYSEDDRIEHGVNLSMAGLATDSYQAIVVDGSSVVLLAAWQP